MPVKDQNVAKIHDASTSLDGKMDVNDAFASAFQEFNESSSMQTTETSLSGISGDDCDDYTLATRAEKRKARRRMKQRKTASEEKKKQGKSWLYLAIDKLVSNCSERCL